MTKKFNPRHVEIEGIEVEMKHVGAFVCHATSGGRGMLRGVNDNCLRVLWLDAKVTDTHVNPRDVMWRVA